jgi:hypothetical protein
MGSVSASQLERTVQCNFLRDGKRVKRGGRASSHPHQPRLNFSIMIDVRQKAAIATLCVLCGMDGETMYSLKM